MNLVAQHILMNLKLFTKTNLISKELNKLTDYVKPKANKSAIFSSQQVSAILQQEH